MITNHQESRLDLLRPQPVVKRLTPNGRNEYLLPFGVGFAFQTCWDGSATRYHHNGITCRSCGRMTDNSFGKTYGSLHLAQRRGSDAPQIVLLADKGTRLLFSQYHELQHLHGDKYPALVVFTGSGKRQSVRVERMLLQFKVLVSEHSADEMMIRYDHLNMVLRRAAAKGYDVPPYLPKRPSSGVSTEDLLAARKKLRDRGITGRAVNAILAKRFGLQTPCVRMRLIRHDRAASASPQPRNLSTEKTVGA